MNFWKESFANKMKTWLLSSQRCITKDKLAMEFDGFGIVAISALGEAGLMDRRYLTSLEEVITL